MLYKIFFFTFLCASSVIFGQKFINQVVVDKNSGVNLIHIMPYTNPEFASALAETVYISPGLTLFAPAGWPSPYVLRQPFDVLVTTEAGILEIKVKGGGKENSEKFDVSTLSDQNKLEVGPGREITISPL